MSDYQENISYAPESLGKSVLGYSIARNSIGNRFPGQKYVGAMVRKSVRVVLVAENDLVEFQLRFDLIFRLTFSCLSLDFQLRLKRLAVAQRQLSGQDRSRLQSIHSLRLIRLGRTSAP